MSAITELAYAKINLSLDILGRLPNGYHEVEMIMQSLKLCDKVTISLNRDFSSRTDSSSDVSFSPNADFSSVSPIELNHFRIFFSTNADIKKIPHDDNNIIIKSVRKLEAFLYSENGTTSFSKTNEAPFPMDSKSELTDLYIYLDKHIPSAAGLAGGSADAAATLRGLNRLLGLNLTLEKLKEIGVKVGADVPYCLMNGTALAQGIGEKLTRLPAAPEFTYVLIKPERGASTKEMYEAVDSSSELVHPDTGKLLKLLDKIDTDHEELCEFLKGLSNVFEPVTMNFVPEVGDIINFLYKNGAKKAMMSGSGPTVFGIFFSEDEANRVFKLAQSAFPGYEIFVTK